MATGCGAAALAVCAMLPMSALAQVATSALPPEGCALSLTVQARSCLTTRIWTCPGDPAGQQRYGVQIGGVHVEVNRVDAGFNPVETHYIEDAAIVTQVEVVDPVDLARLAVAGTETFDYVRRGDDGRADERYVGEMALMGRIVTMEGMSPEEWLHMVFVTYDVQREGAEPYSGSAVQYLSADKTMLYYGNDYDAEGAQLTDYTPLRFLAPGADAVNESCEG